MQRTTRSTGLSGLLVAAVRAHVAETALVALAAVAALFVVLRLFVIARAHRELPAAMERADHRSR